MALADEREIFQKATESHQVCISPKVIRSMSQRSRRSSKNTRSKYTVNEIAWRCGFADNAHFSHAFKRIFHITPSEYIKTNQ